jgi:hypothetical protein
MAPAATTKKAAAAPKAKASHASYQVCSLRLNVKYVV